MVAYMEAFLKSDGSNGLQSIFGRDMFSRYRYLALNRATVRLNAHFIHWPPHIKYIPKPHRHAATVRTRSNYIHISVGYLCCLY